VELLQLLHLLQLMLLVVLVHLMLLVHLHLLQLVLLQLLLMMLLQVHLELILLVLVQIRHLLWLRRSHSEVGHERGGHTDRRGGEFVDLGHFPPVTHLLHHFLRHTRALSNLSAPFRMASEVHADLLRPTHEFEATINAFVSSVRALGQSGGASGEDYAVILLCVPGR
jgi:hypothetical protein